MRIPTFNPATAAFAPLPVAWADLQNLYLASDNANAFVSCPDGPTGASLAYSDGTTWRMFAKGVQTFVKNADSSGNATFTFSPAFASTPMVLVGIYDTTNTNMVISQKITSQTTTSVTVQVRRQQLLPATLTLLSSLTNFDVFGGGNLSAISIGVAAFPPPLTGT